MMTYLMHLTNSTADMTPTRWEVFRKAHSKAKVLKCQNVVRAFTKDRFTTFSWSEGLKSYTGYIAANSVDKNKIIVPYRANNTGNLLGWYMVSGKRTDAVPVLSGRYQLQGDAYIMNGELKTNGQTLDQRFAIYSTDGNAVIYLDQVTAITDGTITGERGGLMAISVDELTKLRRNLYTKEGMTTSDGTKMSILNTPWLNIDNAVGFVSRSGKTMAFGDIANNNSIMTAKAYILHSDQQRDFKANETIDCRHVVYYSNISSHETACMEQELCVLTDMLPEGWNGLIASDPDGTTYLLLSHFSGAKNEVTLKGVTNKSQLGAPVFNVETMIHKSQSTATFSVEENSSHGCKISFFIEGTGLTAKADETSIDITANKRAKATIHLIDKGREYKRTIKIRKGKHIRLTKAELPEMLEGFVHESILARAQKKGLAEIHLHNLRDYTTDKWRRVDDYPYGGFAGMVMQCEPIDRAISALKAERDYDEVIFTSPDGEQFSQEIANDMSMLGNIIILCGHYKGIDQRIRDHLITREISIGDYVLTGGELAAAVMADAIIRLVPGVISDDQSALSDCFQDGLLSAPIYTRPANYKGWQVPEILLSGNEGKIKDWEIEQRLERKKRLRPDLLK